jgi:hypothetical protein
MTSWSKAPPARPCRNAPRTGSPTGAPADRESHVRSAISSSQTPHVLPPCPRSEERRADADSACSPEVGAILTDIYRWHCRGVSIVMVEPTPDSGVHLRVRAAPDLAEALLRSYYRFHITCSAWT